MTTHPIVVGVQRPRVLRNQFRSIDRIGIIILLAFVVRLTLAPFTGHRLDMNIWRTLAAHTYSSPMNPFMRQFLVESSEYSGLQFYYSYPPLWLVTLLTSYSPFLILPASMQTGIFQAVLENFFVKLPLIVADVLIGYFIHRFGALLGFNRKQIGNAVLLWMFNPYVIWISSVWGMFDSLPVLFGLLATYFLIRGRLGLSALLLTTSISFKLYPALLLPFFLLYLVRNSRRWKIDLMYYLGSAVAGLTIFMVLPYLLTGDLKPLILLVSGRTHTTIAAAGTTLVSGLTYQRFLPISTLQRPWYAFPMLFGALILLYIFWSTRRIGVERPFSDKLAFLGVLVAVHIVAYLSYNIVNEQYLLWSLPLIILFSISSRSELRVLSIVFWGIGLLAILSHYHPSYFLDPRLFDVTPVANPLSYLYGGLAIDFSLVCILILLTLWNPPLKTREGYPQPPTPKPYWVKAVQFVHTVLILLCVPLLATPNILRDLARVPLVVLSLSVALSLLVAMKFFSVRRQIATFAEKMQENTRSLQLLLLTQVSLPLFLYLRSGQSWLLSRYDSLAFAFTALLMAFCFVSVCAGEMRGVILTILVSLFVAHYLGLNYDVVFWMPSAMLQGFLFDAAGILLLFPCSMLTLIKAAISSRSFS